jgi:hypothetical protein
VGQGLEIIIKDNQLDIQHSEVLRLSYLAADQFQKLDWEPGYAYYPDGSSKQFEGMKYDPSQDLIQVSTGGYILTLLPGVIDGVSMEIENVVTRIFVKVPMKKAVFMEVLSSGRLNLLIYRKVKDESAQMDDNKVTVRFEKAEEIIKFEEELYVWGPKGVYKLKGSNKSLLSMMSDHSADIEEFLDENSIKSKDVADLKRVFDYYNGLD